MRFAAVLNREGGSLRTLDLDAFSETVKTVLEEAGHSVTIDVVEGKDIVEALTKASRKRSVDVVLAGGGDGTISAAAGILMDAKPALAILPAGTMNLFARSLGIPQSLDEALAAFADGELRAVDVASANGQPFVHQFSIGLHAKMVHLRDKMDFGSRLGKIGASARAAYRTVMKPPSMSVTLKIGEAEIMTRTSGIGVTNNLFGEGHLPYADTPDGGVLGIYVTVARERFDFVRMAVNMARGRWRDNEQVEIHQAQKVVLTLNSSARRFKSVIDGELCELERKTTVETHPKALNVLVPRSNKGSKAA